MKRNQISRREFIRLLALSGLSTAFSTYPAEYYGESIRIGRVAVRLISVYHEPSFRSRSIGHLLRDELVSLTEEVIADEGPAYNPCWYQTPHGYVHSGNLQLVQWQPQAPVTFIPQNGALFEVSVPYTRSYRKPNPYSTPLYRLYYRSTAWVKSVQLGEDGRMWYGLLDDVFGIQYYARAEHLRQIQSDELTPISSEVPWSEKKIEIDLTSQRLHALEYGQVVFETKISSGIPSSEPTFNGIPTKTPFGRFYITRKMPLRHMGDGKLTSDLEAYELPGVPWVCFFHITGIAVHGTYWHTDFGRPRSHGCVNVATDDAQWLYRWSFPIVPLEEMMVSGYGTPVIVR